MLLLRRGNLWVRRLGAFIGVPPVGISGIRNLWNQLEHIPLASRAYKVAGDLSVSPRESESVASGVTPMLLGPKRMYPRSHPGLTQPKPKTVCSGKWHRNTASIPPHVGREGEKGDMAGASHAPCIGSRILTHAGGHGKPTRSRLPTTPDFFSQLPRISSQRLLAPCFSKISVSGSWAVDPTTHPRRGR